MTVHHIELLSKATGDYIAAELRDELARADLDSVDADWQPSKLALRENLEQAGIPKTDWPQSLSWQWSLLGRHLQYIAYSGFGIFCMDHWQGAMLTKTAPYVSRIPGQNGLPIVYLDYVESAPWNWPVPEISQVGEFGGVGISLVRRAVIQSFDEGFGGRLGLHSLRQSEQFYADKCGMTDLKPDPGRYNLRYFEFSGEQAARFLR